MCLVPMVQPMGCRRWTGVTVALAKGVPERKAKGDRASKDLTAELNLQKVGHPHTPECWYTTRESHPPCLQPVTIRPPFV